MTKTYRVGDTIVRDGQTYVFDGLQSYVTKAGKSVYLRLWRTKCLTCGKPFIATSNRSARTEMNRRCEVHKRPGHKPSNRERAKLDAR